MQVKWLGAYDLCLLDVSASLLSPRGHVATLALVNMQPGCQLAKPAATQRWHHRRPWWLAANANTKMFLVFSFSLSFFLLTTWWSFVCGRQLLLPYYPHTSSSPGWTTFSTRLATSWIAVDTFCLLSSIFQIDWLRLRLLLLLSEQENNSKILCKYFVCIFHLIFNLLSFFMVFLFLFSPPHLYDPLFLCLFQTHEEFMALWPRVFLFLFCWGCVGVALSTAAILMNSIDWTRTSTKFIFSVVPLLSYTKSKVNQSFHD